MAGSRIVVNTDGYADAGAAGWAFVARGGALDHAEGGALPVSPSHVAEWAAVAHALAWALDALQAGDELVLRTDSALVAKGLASRRPAMSGEAAELRAECRRMLARLAENGVRAKVERVGREANAEADALAHESSRQR